MFRAENVAVSQLAMLDERRTRFSYLFPREELVRVLAAVFSRLNSLRVGSRADYVSGL